MLNSKAILKVLGLPENIKLIPEDMAKSVTVCFFPVDQTNKLSDNVLNFSEQLRRTFSEIGVNIITFSEAIEKVAISKRVKRLLACFINNLLYGVEILFKNKSERIFFNYEIIKGILKKNRIKPGVSVIALGENNLGKMPIDFASSFRLSSVITILDRPANISKSSNFFEHFDTAMNFFSYHMSNIIILVTKDEWLVYNFNASHPIYVIGPNMKNDVLIGLLPKIAAPILPVRLSDFDSYDGKFSVRTPEIKHAIDELSKSGKIFETLNLYPKGKSFSDLPFRNKFHEWIGKIHLDHRTGMSYGFLAWQLPVKLPEVLEIKESARNEIQRYEEDGLYEYSGKKFVKLSLLKKDLLVEVPQIWVLSQRSGSDKTNLNPERDLIKLGLVDSKLYLESVEGNRIKKDFRPSFDTMVILAHALGNTFIAALLNYFEGNNVFSNKLKEKGLAIFHWHGYINKSNKPNALFIHGHRNPHVSCSSPQSAFYSLDGKMKTFIENYNIGKNYNGDIHIEPQHGTNISYLSLIDFATHLSQNNQVAVLGNKYLSDYY